MGTVTRELLERPIGRVRLARPVVEGFRVEGRGGRKALDD